MLNHCLPSSSAGVHSQKPLCSHHLQALSSHSSISAVHKSNLKASLLPTDKTLQRRKLSLVCRHSEYLEPHQPQWGSSNVSPISSQPGPLPPKVFVGHSIYKGKAALTVVPCAPEFSPLDGEVPGLTFAHIKETKLLGGKWELLVGTAIKGNWELVPGTESGAFKLSKEGFVLLQFAPAAGVRQYDWSRKQVFSLSVTELGSLISLGGKESCDFFHDPNKGKSDEGKVRKVLKIEPLPDGSGHFFNLSVQNKLINVDESIYIPVTRAEFTVLVSAFNFVLPYLLGWHTCVSSFIPDEETSHANTANPRSGAAFEWQR